MVVAGSDLLPLAEGGDEGRQAVCLLIRDQGRPAAGRQRQRVREPRPEAADDQGGHLVAGHKGPAGPQQHPPGGHQVGHLLKGHLRSGHSVRQSACAGVMQEPRPWAAREQACINSQGTLREVP